MAPGRSFGDVFTVFVDDILCSGILTDDGISLSTARFFWDSYLLNDTWPKQFGGAWSNQFFVGCFMQRAKNRFESTLDKLMKKF